jgi:hypothetical protein
MSDGRYDPAALAPELQLARLRKVDRMADALLVSAIDLGDERAVIRLLQANGELAGDILTHLDAAIERARAISQGAAA